MMERQNVAATKYKIIARGEKRGDEMIKSRSITITLLFFVGTFHVSCFSMIK